MMSKTTWDVEKKLSSAIAKVNKNMIYGVAFRLTNNFESEGMISIDLWVQPLYYDFFQ